MATVRLMLYDHNGKETSCADIAGDTILDAATDAAVRGMETDREFLVVEAEDMPHMLYWVGRRTQKTTREEARKLLAAKLERKGL